MWGKDYPSEGMCLQALGDNSLRNNCQRVLWGSVYPIVSQTSSLTFFRVGNVCVCDSTVSRVLFPEYCFERENSLSSLSLFWKAAKSVSSAKKNSVSLLWHIDNRLRRTHWALPGTRWGPKIGWCPSTVRPVFPMLVFQLSKRQNRTRTTFSTVLGTPPSCTWTKRFPLEELCGGCIVSWVLKWESTKNRHFRSLELYTKPYSDTSWKKNSLNSVFEVHTALSETVPSPPQNSCKVNSEYLQNRSCIKWMLPIILKAANAHWKESQEKLGKCSCIKKIIVSEPKIVTAHLKYSQE